MMSRNIITLVGVGVPLIAVGSVRADFTGLSLEYTNTFFTAHPNGPLPVPPGVDIWRLYATFNSNTASDRINGVFGTSSNPIIVNVFGGMFWNYTETDPQSGSLIHFNLAYSGPNPMERTFDTHVTIGNVVNGGVTQLSPNFGTETNNLGYESSSIYSENAAWWVTPLDAQGQAVAAAPGQPPAPAGIFRVLLAQFTITEGAFMNGWVSLDVGGVLYENQYFAVPSHGALMVLAVTGLIGVRQRRRT